MGFEKLPEIVRRWGEAQAFPLWAKIYIKQSLIHHGFMFLDDEDANSGTSIEEMSRSIRKVFNSLDISLTEEQLNELARSYQVGIEHLDKIALRMGLIEESI